MPDYWTIGEVYERLIEDISDDNKDSIIEHMMEVYSSWISDAISDYNSDFFYKELIYDTFPDLNDGNIKIKSYNYTYTPGLFFLIMRISASFVVSVDYFPTLINKLELAGLKKIPDDNCYARYQSAEEYHYLYFDVTFNHHKKIILNKKKEDSLWFILHQILIK